jgi:predicted negative regulator of RcsB-dependent stress response
MNRYALFTRAALIVAAFVVWFWPQHRRLEAARSEARALQTELDRAEARERLGDMPGQLLNLSDAVLAKNYGRAAALDRVLQLSGERRFANG